MDFLSDLQKEQELLEFMRKRCISFADVETILRKNTHAMHRLTVEQAAALMEVDPQFIRVGLQQKALPFGYAVKGSGKKYRYFISAEKFTETTGIEVPAGMKTEAVYEEPKEG